MTGSPMPTVYSSGQTSRWWCTEQVLANKETGVGQGETCCVCVEVEV